MTYDKDKPYKWPYDGEEVIPCGQPDGGCKEPIYFRTTKAGHKVAITYATRLLHRLTCPCQTGEKTMKPVIKEQEKTCGECKHVASYPANGKYCFKCGSEILK